MIKGNMSFILQLQTVAYYGHDARLTGVTAKQVVSSLSHDDRLSQSFREASLEMSKHRVDCCAAWKTSTGRFFALCNAIYYRAIVISMPARFSPGDADISVLAIANHTPKVYIKKVYAIVTTRLRNPTVSLP